MADLIAAVDLAAALHDAGHLSESQTTRTVGALVGRLTQTAIESGFTQVEEVVLNGLMAHVASGGADR